MACIIARSNDHKYVNLSLEIHMLQLRLQYWTNFEELRSDAVEKKNFPSWL